MKVPSALASFDGTEWNDGAPPGAGQARIRKQACLGSGLEKRGLGEREGERERVWESGGEG